MLKRLAIVAFLCLTTVTYAQIPRYGSHPPQPRQRKDGDSQVTSQPCLCKIQIQPSFVKGAEHGQAKRYPWRKLLAPANIPNWFLVAVGFWAGLMALRTLNSIKHQAVLQFRPKLTIRRILIYKGTQIPTIESKGDIPWRVGFYMSNHGGSAAHVRECDFSLIRLESELPPRPTHFQQTRPRPFSLVPGEERELSIELDENTTSLFRLLGDDRLRQGWQNSDRIYFSGVAREC